MADRIPIKGIFNGSGDPTGLAEFTVSDTIGYADGGTGLNTLGTAYQVLQVNSGATALEYTTISNQNLTNSTISIAADSGSTDPISLGETLTISGDTGITTTVGANSLSIDLDDTAVTPGSYGSATAIPTFTVDQQGRLTAASTINVATTLNISDDSSTTTGISLLNDTLNFKGDTGITTTISGDSINIDLDDTAVTPGTYGSTTAIPTFTVDQQGRITNVSTNTVSTTLSISDDSSTTASINLLNDTLNISGTTNEIETSITGDTIQIGLPDDVTIGNNLTVTGDLTVNGTTTTVNSTTLTVDDKNIELGSTASPTDTSADGGGITLKGTTDKTFNWIDSTDSWTSSEHLDLASGKEFKINNSTVLSSSQVLGKSLPSGDVIGSSDTQVLTNKTIDTANNTITIVEADISDLGAYITASSSDTLTNKSGNISQWTNDSGYLTSFTETNDLTAAVTWANVPDANITQSSVTQHQAALSITESQISDLQSYITATSTDVLQNKTISGSNNTISNIGNGSLTNSTTTFTGDSGTTAISLGGTLNVIGDTGITVSATTGQLSVDLDDTAVTPGSYGSSTAVPVITIDQQGRITSASTSSISTDLTIRDSSSTTDTVTLGTDTLSFLGTDNEITATVSNNAVTLALPYAVSIETDTGLIQRDVNFYSRADGLSTANSTLTFSAGGDTNVFTAFTYADGTTGTGSVLFHF